MNTVSKNHIIEQSAISDYRKTLSVLTCDDRQKDLASLVSILHSGIDNIYSAQDGEEGYRIFCDNDIDMVITDVRMPKQSGLDMARKIRKLNPEVPIIIISGSDESDKLLDAIEIGVDHYLIKPIDPSQLNKIIDKSITYLLKSELEQQQINALVQESILKAKSEMLHDFAHHWRQPLNYIGLTSEIMCEVDHAETHESHLKRLAEGNAKINATLQKLSKTIDTFRGIFKSRFDYEDIPVRKAVQALIDDVLLSEEKTQVEVQIHIEDTLLLRQNKADVNIVLYQVIKNALEAVETIPNPCIIIHAGENTSSTWIEICDNGEGIAPEIKSHIYEPYTSTKGPKAGRGFGLFMTYSLLKSHLKGDIFFERRDNRTCFKIHVENLRQTPPGIAAFHDA